MPQCAGCHRLPSLSPRPPELRPWRREDGSLISAAEEARCPVEGSEMSSLCVLSYVAFDFHKECSHMRWERLQILVDSVAETQDEYG